MTPLPADASSYVGGAVQVYEDELVITQPSPFVVNMSVKFRPPLRVSSRNVPRRSSLGLT